MSVIIKNYAACQKEATLFSELLIVLVGWNYYID